MLRERGVIWGKIYILTIFVRGTTNIFAKILQSIICSLKSPPYGYNCSKITDQQSLFRFRFRFVRYRASKMSFIAHLTGHKSKTEYAMDSGDGSFDSHGHFASHIFHSLYFRTYYNSMALEIDGY